MSTCHKFTNQLTAKLNKAIHQFTNSRSVRVHLAMEDDGQLPNGQKWGPSPFRPFLGTAYGMNHAAVQQLFLPLNIGNTAKHKNMVAKMI